MSSEALKPCPFCGCKPSTTTYYIECDCAMEPRIDWFHVSRESAIANWNRRTTSPSVLELVEACKGLVPTLRSGDWGNQDETADEIDKALAAVEREIGNA